MPVIDKRKKLKKQLGAFDVFAIATGAMFSSGLFLLPGIAAGVTGPSVYLAYLVSGLLVLPTMFSKAELATALPRAGGTYYIIDRALGPLMGSIGGFGSWLSLIFKSAFALIGMGAYISIFFDVPITPVAVMLTLAFGALNIFGAKETTKVQNFLVIALISIMVFYLVQGFAHLFSIGFLDIHKQQFQPFFTNGFQGFFATVGMVFVSYAGLTKVVSVAEEVQDPDRNIPRGMFLSILTAIAVYVSGVYLMTALLEPSAFREDLTPVATAGQVFLDWLPGDTGLILIVFAAIAAFASTGNAGIMSASRFPLAMARDKLIHKKFAVISARFSTPIISIVATTGMMMFLLLVFNVEAVAKLASAFKLLLFGLLNLAVIVMRESKIKEYDPGFTSPFYPWLQMFGMLVSCLLILEMGILSILFTVAVMVMSVAWYYYYAYGKIDRQGAIFHVHERLGKFKDQKLEHEMRRILREKGLRDDDPYELVVSQSQILDIDESDITYEKIFNRAGKKLASKMDLSSSALIDNLGKMDAFGGIAIGKGSALVHTRIEGKITPELLIVRIKNGLQVKNKEISGSENGKESTIYAIFFLISSKEDSTQHLRFLAHIAEMVDKDNFLDSWKKAGDEKNLKEILLRDERFINLKVRTDGKYQDLIGKRIMDIDLPGNSLITIIKRNGNIQIPHGDTIIEEDDKLSIIGDPYDINELKE